MTWAAVAGLIACAVIFTFLGYVIGISLEAATKAKLDMERYKKANEALRKNLN